VNNRTLANLSPLQLGLIALGVSLGSALGVMLVTRMAGGMRGEPADHPESGPSDTAGAERIPPQPEIDTAMPDVVPSHFSENLVIPGFTETGAQVEQDDDTQGRSPEGV
jgi:hypothetical protein